MGLLCCRQFDDAFTTRLWGYENTDAYYSVASSARRVHEVRPLCGLHTLLACRMLLSTADASMVVSIITAQLIASGRLLLADLLCTWLQIKVPLLALNAEDDPIVTAAALPLKASEQSSSVVLATSRTGGHVAHFEVGGWLCIVNRRFVFF